MRRLGPWLTCALTISPSENQISSEVHHEEDYQCDDASVRTYRLRKQPFDALQRWLSEVESFWSAELQAFKLHAERTRGNKKA
jgi:hypothetical protein